MKIDRKMEITPGLMPESHPIKKDSSVETGFSCQDKAMLNNCREASPEEGLDKKALLKAKNQQDLENRKADQAVTGDSSKPSAESPSNPQLAQELEGLLNMVLTDPEAEAQVIGLISQLNSTGQLKPVLHMVAEQAKEAGTLPAGIPQEKVNEIIDQLSGMIDAELRSHGMTPETQNNTYQSWEKMGAEHLDIVRNSQIPVRGPGELSAFTEPSFIKELESLQGAPFVQGNSITPLIDGPESFKCRNELIDGARKSIHMMTWAFYDDETGWDTAKKLAEKHSQGVDVKVIVDGQVARKSNHSKTLEFLEKQGVPLVRWQNPDEPYHGQHRKLMIVDGKAAVAGGLNAGNAYSHMGPADAPKWRDTDVLLKGPAVANCEKLFASVFGCESPKSSASGVEGSAKTAVVNHSPGEDAHIMLANMKAIQGASESVDIENAYFIQTPGMKGVLMDAIERGVKVRILTNSAESIDEKIITAPILKSLPELVEKGAEVYLKKGDTLHSKFMVVDGLYSSVGSYNLHPRSERYEGEMTLNTLDANTAGALGKVFQEDIGKAVRITSPEQVAVPEDPFTIIASRYFFDQL